MSDDEGRNLLQKFGFPDTLIDKCFTPLVDGWRMSAHLDGRSTLRIEHSNGNLTSEFAVNLQTGDWVLFDVGSTYTEIGRGREQLPAARVPLSNSE